MVAFTAIGSQQRVAQARGGLVYLGLDYAGARAGLELAGIAITAETWRGVQVMEAETCRVLNAAGGEA